MNSIKRNEQKCRWKGEWKTASFPLFSSSLNLMFTGQHASSGVNVFPYCGCCRQWWHLTHTYPSGGIRENEGNDHGAIVQTCVWFRCGEGWREKGNYMWLESAISQGKMPTHHIHAWVNIGQQSGAQKGCQIYRYWRTFWHDKCLISRGSLFLVCVRNVCLFSQTLMTIRGKNKREKERVAMRDIEIVVGYKSS